MNDQLSQGTVLQSGSVHRQNDATSLNPNLVQHPQSLSHHQHAQQNNNHHPSHSHNGHPELGNSHSIGLANISNQTPSSPQQNLQQNGLPLSVVQSSPSNGQQIFYYGSPYSAQQLLTSASLYPNLSVTASQPPQSTTAQDHNSSMHSNPYVLNNPSVKNVLPLIDYDKLAAALAAMQKGKKDSRVKSPKTTNSRLPPRQPQIRNCVVPERFTGDSSVNIAKEFDYTWADVMKLFKNVAKKQYDGAKVDIHKLARSNLIPKELRSAGLHKATLAMCARELCKAGVLKWEEESVFSPVKTWNLEEYLIDPVQLEKMHQMDSETESVSQSSTPNPNQQTQYVMSVEPSDMMPGSPFPELQTPELDQVSNNVTVVHNAIPDSIVAHTHNNNDDIGKPQMKRKRSQGMQKRKFDYQVRSRKEERAVMWEIRTPEDFEWFSLPAIFQHKDKDELLRAIEKYELNCLMHLSATSQLS